jgi:hypothetical protein
VRLRRQAPGCRPASIWAGAEHGQALAGEPASVGISDWASAVGLVPGRADQVAAQPGGGRQGRGRPEGDRTRLEQLPRSEICWPGSSGQ